jgi:hypothetical protein
LSYSWQFSFLNVGRLKKGNSLPVSQPKGWERNFVVEAAARSSAGGWVNGPICHELAADLLKGLERNFFWISVLRVSG